MPLSNKIHDLNLSKKERKLRDGIFNMNTRRFGKVAEFMIAKLYECSSVQGKTNYDLTDKNGLRVEVKFSRMEYIEENMTLENCLRICMENSNPVSRRISFLDSFEYDDRFDRNIEQIKAYEFDRMYYGLFFDNQIAIFSMTAEEIKSVMTAQFFIAKKKSPLPSVIAVKELVVNNPNKKKKITKEIKKVVKKIESITESSNQYAVDAKGYIRDEGLLEKWNDLAADIEGRGEITRQQVSTVLNICEQYFSFCKTNFIKTGRFPDVSPFQHRGNDKAEGQMHFTHENVKWHIKESGYFCGWLSYKDLYELLNY